MGLTITWTFVKDSDCLARVGSQALTYELHWNEARQTLTLVAGAEIFSPTHLWFSLHEGWEVQEPKPVNNLRYKLLQIFYFYNLEGPDDCTIESRSLGGGGGGSSIFMHVNCRCWIQIGALSTCCHVTTEEEKRSRGKTPVVLYDKSSNRCLFMLFFSWPVGWFYLLRYKFVFGRLRPHSHRYQRWHVKMSFFGLLPILIFSADLPHETVFLMLPAWCACIIRSIYFDWHAGRDFRLVGGCDQPWAGLAGEDAPLCPREQTVVSVYLLKLENLS